MRLTSLPTINDVRRWLADDELLMVESYVPTLMPKHPLAASCIWLAVKSLRAVKWVWRLWQ